MMQRIYAVLETFDWDASLDEEDIEDREDLSELSGNFNNLLLKFVLIREYLQIYLNNFLLKEIKW